jgi:hypothetical protein
VRPLKRFIIRERFDLCPREESLFRLCQVDLMITIGFPCREFIPGHRLLLDKIDDCV